MKIVSTNYTGVIPGIGKGPFTNKCISDQLYNQVRNLGYPVVITSVKAKPKVVVQNVSQKVDKKPITKVEEAVKTAEKIATETAKPVEKPVEEQPKEAVATAKEPEVVDATVESKETQETVSTNKRSKEALEAMDVKELDKMLTELDAGLKRPVRYGKPWLIKQIMAR